jgi:hypothetical protein
MNWYLAGGNESSLGGFPSPKSKKRGRPALAPIEHLVPRCESLLGFFENYWAEVAWDLQRARSLPQIRGALRRAGEGQVHSELDLFIIEETKTGSTEELALQRGNLRKNEAQLRASLQDEPDISRKLEQADRAAKQFPSNPKIQELQQRAQRNADYLSRKIKTLNDRVNQLETEVRRREAHFSQSAMLEFFQSDRYTPTPLSVAKAMAGVPRITWRQSAARLAKVAIRHPQEAEYKRFQMFASSLGRTIPKDSKSAIDRIENFLKRKSSRDYAVQRLRSEWYFVKIGIESTYAESLPKKALPFRAFQAYRSRANAPLPGDQLLAEDEAL